jgi:hypothetical protein
MCSTKTKLKYFLGTNASPRYLTIITEKYFILVHILLAVNGQVHGFGSG